MERAWYRIVVTWRTAPNGGFSGERNLAKDDQLAKTGRNRAAWVALGILCSRVFGLVREAVATALLGVGPLADVFATAFRAPNVLQNLLGEQSLSASFIPVYTRFLDREREEEAGRFAGAVLGLLLVVVSAVALLGVVFAEPIVAIFAAGYLRDAAEVAAAGTGVDRFPVAVRAVRITFPATAVLVLSAWALGILNSHRRFFLAYFAPVLWNMAIIVALFIGAGATRSGATLDQIVIWGCLGALAGALLQLLVQAPLVLRLLRGFRLRLSLRVAGVRDALRAFWPLLAARGAAQLSGYLDHFLATLLVAGAVGAIRWSLILYLLPVSLFGLSVAAAELPELATAAGAKSGLAGRTRSSLRQIAFLVVPTNLGYLVFGYLIVATIYRHGRFQEDANWLVYLTLCGYALGLLATAWSRLLSNVFYAHGETRTPARIAVVRVVLSALLGALLMFYFDRYSVAATMQLAGPESLHFGALGLALASAVASWLELLLLRRGLRRFVPGALLPLGRTVRLAAVAAVSVLPAAACWWLFRAWPAILAGPVVVGLYGAIYLWIAHRLGLSDLDAWLGSLRRRGVTSEGREA